MLLDKSRLTSYIQVSLSHSSIVSMKAVDGDIDGELIGDTNNSRLTLIVD